MSVPPIPHQSEGMSRGVNQITSAFLKEDTLLQMTIQTEDDGSYRCSVITLGWVSPRLDLIAEVPALRRLYAMLGHHFQLVQQYEGVQESGREKPYDTVEQLRTLVADSRRAGQLTAIVSVGTLADLLTVLDGAALRADYLTEPEAQALLRLRDGRPSQAALDEAALVDAEARLEGELRQRIDRASEEGA